jgi:hypothetical protein
MNRSIYHSYFRLQEKLKLSVQPWLKQAKFMLLRISFGPVNSNFHFEDCSEIFKKVIPQ